MKISWKSFFALRWARPLTLVTFEAVFLTRLILIRINYTNSKKNYQKYISPENDLFCYL